MIKSVQFASNKNTRQRNNIDIAKPSSDRGSITVICGKNHSGKTYISKRIHRSITQRNKDLEKNPKASITRHGVDNIYTEFHTGNNQIDSVLITRIANITDLLKGVSIYYDNNHKSRKHLQRSDNYFRIQIKDALEELCFECIQNTLNKRGKSIDINQWQNPESIEYRKEILRALSRDSLYITPRENLTIRKFEELTSGKLYFGINNREIAPHGDSPEFDFRLAFNGDIILPLGAWSEGQKVIFSLLILIHYLKPQVFIIDEIENHLHPEFISTLLQLCQRNVRQTIITTHHPHIIFSRYVDMVNYLEFSKSANELPDVLDKKRSEKMKSMKQTNVLLGKNYSKLISTYKLFDNYDNQLLRLSISSLADLNDLLVDIFTSLFTYDIIGPKKSRKPDLQSQKLFETIEKKLGEEQLQILEYGAGEGRLLIDIDKILKTPQKDKIIWNLFEPFEKPRKKLENHLENQPYKDLIKVFGSRPKEKFDFIIIPNVLHELTSKTIADILHYCSQSLKPDGSIIIVELFPLIKPEKYAVPLRSTEWSKLARSLGFRATTKGINFKNALHEAYFTELHLPNKNKEFNREEIESIIKEFWSSEVLLDRCSEYDGHLRLGDSDEIPTTLGLLCTIASITANNNGTWET